ncbi:M50 family metallopeptidase [Arthrobacter sp. KK5.5]|uniref:M50 family metallopeptidase n=1 Tax=Arthrobacter sp. KK5.5 TaxID=3373084 RepID=UPI003EE47941
MTVLLFIAGVVIVAVGIALSIALHEVGHLVPAKLFGVRVPQYMVGFGKTVWSTRRGETEYGLKAIPLGGYVSMIGMYPPAKSGEGQVRQSSTGMFQQLADDARKAAAEQLRPGDEDRMFHRLPVWKRIVIMLGGPLMNLVIGTLLIAVVVTGFGTVQATTTVSEVFQCVVTDEEQAERERQGGTDCRPSDPEAPAYAAGLLPGDVVTSFDGTAVGERDWMELTEMIRAAAGRQAPITYLRDGVEHTATIEPLLTERPELDINGRPLTEADGTVQTVRVGFIGMGSEQRLMTLPVGEVPGLVGENVRVVAGVVLDLPARMAAVARAAFSDAPRDPNGPISVVGVGRIAGEVSAMEEIPLENRFATLIGLVASLNIALFVFNLVPLLPLDGGHIAGALWEALRRGFAKVFRLRDPGPVDIAKLLPVTYVVAALMLGMGILLIYADIVKPVNIF